MSHRRFLSPLPSSLRAFHLYHKIPAISSLVDLRRSVPTHARRSQQFFVFIPCKNIQNLTVIVRTYAKQKTNRKSKNKKDKKNDWEDERSQTQHALRAQAVSRGDKVAVCTYEVLWNVQLRPSLRKNHSIKPDGRQDSEKQKRAESHRWKTKRANFYVQLVGEARHKGPKEGRSGQPQEYQKEKKEEISRDQNKLEHIVA